MGSVINGLHGHTFKCKFNFTDLKKINIIKIKLGSAWKVDASKRNENLNVGISDGFP